MLQYGEDKPYPEDRGRGRGAESARADFERL